MSTPAAERAIELAEELDGKIGWAGIASRRSIALDEGSQSEIVTILRHYVELRAKAEVQAGGYVERRLLNFVNQLSEKLCDDSSGVSLRDVLRGAQMTLADCASYERERDHKQSYTAQPAQAELPNGYEAVTPGYIRWVSPAQYAKFSEEVQKWYRPYWAAETPAQDVSVPAILTINALKSASRMLRRWGEQYGSHDPKWLPPSGHVDTLELIDEALAATEQPK